eukprot:Em0008g180a
MTSVINTLVVILACINFSSTQSPGDGSSECQNPPFTKTPFPSNIVPLMDSYDYIELTAAMGGPWNTLNIDGDTNAVNIMQLTTYQLLSSCGYANGPQNNWLVTQHIKTTVDGGALKQVIVRLNFSLNGCPTGGSCQQSFLLQLYETFRIDPNGSLNTSNYKIFSGSRVAVGLNPSGTIVETHDVTVPLFGYGGLYLAVQDTGTCVSLTRLTVFYYVCPQQVVNFINYPMTLADGSITQLTCVSGAGYYRPAGSGADSGCILGYLPGPPVNLTANGIGSTFVVLHWLPPEVHEAVEYSVYYALNGIQIEAVLFIKGIKNTSVNVTGLMSSTVYRFTVAAQSVFIFLTTEKNVSIVVQTADEAQNTAAGTSAKSSKQQPQASEKTHSDFLMEASIMGQFNHPNVIKLYGVITKVEPVMIVMEFMVNGSLCHFLLHNRHFALQKLLNVAKDVAQGMQYLAEVGYVHRDLAARNVLVSKDEVCKVADFGLSRETTNDEYDVKKGGKIPVRWTAPEAISYLKFTTASDVWSYGVLLWEVMSYGQQPYEDWDNQTGCPNSVYSVMLSCWKGEENERPNFEEIVKMLDSLLINKGKSKSQVMPVITKAGISAPKSPIDYPTVQAWLEAIKMEQYLPNFQSQGILTTQDCLLLNASDIRESLGILISSHANKIMNSIKAAHKAIQIPHL